MPEFGKMAQDAANAWRGAVSNEKASTLRSTRLSLRESDLFEPFSACLEPPILVGVSYVKSQPATQHPTGRILHATPV